RERRSVLLILSGATGAPPQSRPRTRAKGRPLGSDDDHRERLVSERTEGQVRYRLLHPQAHADGAAAPGHAVAARRGRAGHRRRGAGRASAVSGGGASVFRFGRSVSRRLRSARRRDHGRHPELHERAAGDSDRRIAGVAYRGPVNWVVGLTIAPAPPCWSYAARLRSASVPAVTHDLSPAHHFGSLLQIETNESTMSRLNFSMSSREGPEPFRKAN